MTRTLLVAFSALLLCSVLAAQTPAKPDFKELEFLVGDWVAGSGSGEPGTATAGEASFHPELNGQVLVRRSFAEYGKGNRHDDLMYIYRNAPGTPLRAIYFDSEGHVIHYAVTTAPNAATFESEASQGPRFRLSYQLAGKDLNGKFEIAAPGSQEFKTYLTWTSKKK